MQTVVEVRSKAGQWSNNSNSCTTNCPPYNL